MDSIREMIMPCHQLASLVIKIGGDSYFIGIRDLVDFVSGKVMYAPIMELYPKYGKI